MFSLNGLGPALTSLLTISSSQVSISSSRSGPTDATLLVITQEIHSMRQRNRPYDGTMQHTKPKAPLETMT
jgi:hypothetical protein